MPLRKTTTQTLSGQVPASLTGSVTVEITDDEAISHVRSLGHTVTLNGTPPPDPDPDPHPDKTPVWELIIVAKDTLSGPTKTFNLTKPGLLRYGLGDRWVYKADVPTGQTLPATNAFFGSDPVPGQIKRVEQLVRGEFTPPKPDPEPNPNPNPNPTPLPDDIKNPREFSYAPKSGIVKSVGRGYSDNHLIYGSGGSALSFEKAKALFDRNIVMIRFIPVYLGFTDRSIDGSMLDKIEESFENAYNAGVQLVMRNAETFNESSTCGFCDAPAHIIRRHIEQLSPLLEAHAATIAYMEAGYIGRWGEWNKSTNRLGDETNPQNTSAQRDIYFAIQDALPRERCVNLRYHGRTFAIHGRSTPLTREEAYSGSRFSRNGATNDYFTIDSDPVGFFRQHNLFVPQGGEPIRWNGSRSVGSAAEQELINMHWQNMNLPGGDFATSWRDSGHYQRFAERLGHRFVLERSVTSSEISRGETLLLDLTIRNEGYGKPYNPFHFDLMVGSRRFRAETVKQTPQLQDNRHYLPDPATKQTTRLALRLPSDMQSGNQPIKLLLPDVLAENHKPYMIQFANEGIYDSATGGHTLGSINIL